MNSRQNAIALFSGALFGLGLAISGMTQPAKVIGFLDIFGAWDPALAFVMGGAVVVYGVGFALLKGRDRAIFAPVMQIPTRRDIDPRLIGGALLFGAGWGLGGFCPGPALTSLATGLGGVLAFVGAMLVGMGLWHLVERARA